MSGTTGELLNALADARSAPLAAAEPAHIQGERCRFKQIVGTGAQLAEEVISLRKDSGAYDFAPARCNFLLNWGQI